jgi:hypothetical protein
MTRDTSRPFVLCAVPSFDYVATDFAMTFAAMLMQPDRSYDAAIQNIKGSVIQDARNELAASALSGAFSHVFFVDSDIVLAVDAIEKLLSHQAPIVGADYAKRQEPRAMAGKPKGHAPNGVLQAMEHLGFGCMLINTAVFERVPKPWFAYPTNTQNSTGEDRWFCQRAIRAGYTVWCDRSLIVGHVGSKVYV